MKSTPRKYATRPDWTQQQLIAYGSPVAIGVVILQAFLTAPPLDLPSVISVLAIAVSLPMLSSAVLIVHAQTSYEYASWPSYLTLVIVIGQTAAFIGVVAALWHISWVVGIVVVVSALLGLAAYRTYLKRLEIDNSPETSSGS